MLEGGGWGGGEERGCMGTSPRFVSSNSLPSRRTTQRAPCCLVGCWREPRDPSDGSDDSIGPGSKSAERAGERASLQEAASKPGEEEARQTPKPRPRGFVQDRSGKSRRHVRAAPRRGLGGVLGEGVGSVRNPPPPLERCVLIPRAIPRRGWGLGHLPS